jgi:hypothetical protein
VEFYFTCKEKCAGTEKKATLEYEAETEGSVQYLYLILFIDVSMADIL